MEIDWLIDIKELETIGGDDKSVTIDNISIQSFGDKLFFSVNQTQNQEDDFQSDTH